MVPERDELQTHRKRKRGTAASAAAAAPYIPEVVVTRTSGFVVFLLSLLFMGMCATGGAGWYFFQLHLQTQDQLVKAQTRLLQLENNLGLLDENASEQLGDIIEKVTDNGTNVANLWAARNVLRTDVGALNTAVEELKATMTSTTETVGNHEKLLNENVAAISARIDEINRNFAGMDNLGGQLTLLNADLNRVKTAMEAVQDDVERRLNGTEQSIESINIYRNQLVNQTIPALQESINRLQQRLAQ
jgi:chromosome segregation ATPase